MKQIPYMTLQTGLRTYHWIGPRGEIHTIILLDGHSSKTSPNDLLLYSQIITSLSSPQRSFFLQQLAINTETPIWSVCRDCRVLSSKRGIHTTPCPWSPEIFFPKKGKWKDCQSQRWQTTEGNSVFLGTELTATVTVYVCSSQTENPSMKVEVLFLTDDPQNKLISPNSKLKQNLTEQGL